jgi:hypothetical protein
MPVTPVNWMPPNKADHPDQCSIARQSRRLDKRVVCPDTVPGSVMPTPFRFSFHALLPFMMAVLPSCAMIGGSDDDEAPVPTLELAREGPYEVVCMDKTDQEVTSYGPLFRVLRDNGNEVRWQYEMEAGLTFIGRFDDLLTCEWVDRRLK